MKKFLLSTAFVLSLTLATKAQSFTENVLQQIGIPYKVVKSFTFGTYTQGDINNTTVPGESTDIVFVNNNYSGVSYWQLYTNADYARTINPLSAWNAYQHTNNGIYPACVRGTAYGINMAKVDGDFKKMQVSTDGSVIVFFAGDGHYYVLYPVSQRNVSANLDMLFVTHN